MNVFTRDNGFGHRSGRQLDKFFKALSDETRRRILRLLEERDRTVSEIVSQFHLSQPTISRHLSVLKEADLVLDQRRGQNVVYSLANGTLAHSVDEFFGEFKQCRPILPLSRAAAARMPSTGLSTRG